jgi:hypothetical protein
MLVGFYNIACDIELGDYVVLSYHPYAEGDEVESVVVRLSSEPGTGIVILIILTVHGTVKVLSTVRELCRCVPSRYTAA